MTRYQQLRRFVIDWCSSKSMVEVMRRTGLDSRKCSNRAAMLRRLGVPLPNIPKICTPRCAENLRPEEIRKLKQLVVS